MKLIKPIFFGECKPVKTYEYSQWEDISFPVKGKKLSTLIKETSKTPRGVVVLCHPKKLAGKQFFVKKGIADMYRSQGFHTVIFDLNGFGESSDRDLKFDLDLHEVVKKSKTIYPHLPLIVHGVSLGGAQAIHGTIRDEDLIDALIIESAVSNPVDYFKHINRKKEVIVAKTYQTIALPFTGKKTVYSSNIKNIKETPILFMYGSKDKITPMWMGEKLYQNANQPKYFEKFETKHLETYKQEPEKYISTLNNFFAKVINK